MGSSRTADVVVVGGGVAGLVTAESIVTRSPGRTVVVLEADARSGGQVVTTVSGGYTVEHAATAMVAPQSEVAELLGRLGLAERVEPAAESARRTALWVGGRLRWVPRTPGEVLSTDLLSRAGKLRALAEPFLGRGPAEEDGSVHEFAARRFGTEFADVLATAFVQGVTAGDARQTSLRGFSARVDAADRAAGRGGLVGQALRAAVARRGPAPRRGWVTFRDGGLALLPAALASTLGGRVELDSPVRRISKGTTRRWSVAPKTGEEIETDVVVLAIPARRAADLVRGLVPDVAKRMDGVPYSDLRVFALGLDRDAFPVVPRGFGFLAPPAEGLGIIGSTISSNAFPFQAPPGKVLVRVFTGGVAHPGAVHLPDAAALDSVLRELRRTLDVRAEPEIVWDFRWPQALPQTLSGHTALVAEIRAGLAELPGLHVVGNSYDGVGLDDTIRAALKLGAGLTMVGAR